MRVDDRDEAEAEAMLKDGNEQLEADEPSGDELLAMPATKAEGQDAWEAHWESVLGQSVKEALRHLAKCTLEDVELVGRLEREGAGRVGIFTALQKRRDELAPKMPTKRTKQPPIVRLDMANTDKAGNPQLVFLHGWAVLAGPKAYPDEGFLSVVVISTSGEIQKVKLSLRTGNPIALDDPYHDELGPLT